MVMILGKEVMGDPKLALTFLWKNLYVCYLLEVFEDSLDGFFK